MAMIAYKCPDITVVVVDINAARIAAWNSDVSPRHPQPQRVPTYIRQAKWPEVSAPAKLHA